MGAIQDVNEADISVHVCLYVFDMLYHNGVSLLQESFATRREHLYSTFKETEGGCWEGRRFAGASPPLIGVGVFMFATKKDSRDVEEIQTFLDESIQGIAAM